MSAATCKFLRPAGGGHRFLALGLALALSCGVGAQEPRPGKAGEAVIEPASMTLAGARVDFELGTLHVPENRSEPNSRLIGVGFARFKGESKTGAPPIFLLPGGPASSYLSELKSEKAGPGVLRMILRFRAIGDVVLVDQRGFSERWEVLKFRRRTPDEPLDQPASLERSTKDFTEMTRAAVAEFEKKGVDLRGYTVKELADDVNDLRAALGYDRISLVGTSFGSQLSFAVMRRHAPRVARALLAGVEPLDCAYDMPSHVLAAVQRIWFAAEQDPGLQPTLPPGGLMAAAREVVRRLEQAPVRVPVPGVTDPATGLPASITLGLEDFQKAPALRTTEGPAWVLSLYRADYERWALATHAARRSRTAEFPMIAGLLDTSLGVTPRRRYLLQTDPATALLGQWNFHGFLATADLWPSADVGDDFRNEVACSIPVVFVHGDWDTQTPVENTLQVAPFFRHGHVLLVERGGHGALNEVSQHLPETMAALLRFLATGNTENLPSRVAVRAPKFKAPDASPQQR